jgi:hypothetical protein
MFTYGFIFSIFPLIIVRLMHSVLGSSQDEAPDTPVIQKKVWLTALHFWPLHYLGWPGHTNNGSCIKCLLESFNYFKVQISRTEKKLFVKICNFDLEQESEVWEN